MLLAHGHWLQIAIQAPQCHLHEHVLVARALSNGETPAHVGAQALFEEHGLHRAAAPVAVQAEAREATMLDCVVAGCPDAHLLGVCCRCVATAEVWWQHTDGLQLRARSNQSVRKR